MEEQVSLGVLAASEMFSWFSFFFVVGAFLLFLISVGDTMFSGWFAKGSFG